MAAKCFCIKLYSLTVWACLLGRRSRRSASAGSTGADAGIQSSAELGIRLRSPNILLHRTHPELSQRAWASAQAPAYAPPPLHQDQNNFSYLFLECRSHQKSFCHLESKLEAQLVDVCSFNAWWVVRYWTVHSVRTTGKVVIKKWCKYLVALVHNSHNVSFAHYNYFLSSL